MTIALDHIDVMPLPPCDFAPETIWDFNKCRRMWLAAFHLYIYDARSVLHQKQFLAERWECFEDVTSEDAPMLRHLCEKLDLDPELAQAGILAFLESGSRLVSIH